MADGNIEKKKTIVQKSFVLINPMSDFQRKYTQFIRLPTKTSGLVFVSERNMFRILRAIIID